MTENFTNPFTGEVINVAELSAKKEEKVERDWEKRFSQDEIEVELMQLNDYAIRHVKNGGGQIVNTINFFLSTYRLEDSREIELGHIDSDNRIIRLNMKRFMTYTRAERSTIYEHLKWHVVLMHESRANVFKNDRQRFELACDIAVNNALKKEGFLIPTGFPTMQSMEGKTAEQIVKHLPPMPPSDKMEALAKNIAQKMIENGEFDSNNPQHRQQLSKEDQETLEQLESLSQQMQKSGVDFNGSKGKQKNEPDKGYWDNPMKGDFSPIQEGVPEDLLKSSVRGLLERLGGINAKLKDRNKDKTYSPFGVSDELMMLEDFLKPEIDWASQLRNVIRTYIPQAKKTFARSNRRMTTFRSKTRLKFKGKKPRVGIPLVCVGVDVSGSVSQEEIHRYMSEIQALAMDNNVQEVQIATFHTEIGQLFELDDQDIANQDMLNIEMEIGGGTDPTDLIKYWDGEKFFGDGYFEKKCLFSIMFTDMEFDQRCMSLDRNYPIIWVCVNNPNADNRKHLQKQDQIVFINENRRDFADPNTW